MILVVWMLGSFIGVAYPLVVGAVLLACMALRRTFRPRAAEWLPLAAPAAAYYLLDFVASRQSWNLPWAVLAITVFASMVIVAACVARKPRWLKAGAVLGAAIAIALWWLLPSAELRLF
jgi:hypothetical protein